VLKLVASLSCQATRPSSEVSQRRLISCHCLILCMQNGRQWPTLFNPMVSISRIGIALAPIEEITSACWMAMRLISQTQPAVAFPVRRPITVNSHIFKLVRGHCESWNSAKA
jgi:hypothetical protein